MKMSSAPDYSIIIPSYNRADFLKKNIPKLLEEQRGQNVEIIVVDDGSQDNTVEVLDSIQNPRLKYISIPNGERGKARNTGVRLSRGRYITFVDSDDILYPHFFEEAHRLIQKYSEPEFVHIAYEIRSRHYKNRIIKHPKRPYKGLLRGNYLSCLGVLLRKDIALKHQFSETRELSGTEDWLLWLKLGARYPLYTSDKVSAALIEHEGRSVQKYDVEKLKMRSFYLLKHLQDDPVFVKRYGWSLPAIKAHMYSYTALHAAMKKKRLESMRFLLNSALTYFPELIRRRTLGIIKNLF